ncbi:MAG: dienelactone hydrolase family protein [Polyangiales bacterium]
MREHADAACAAGYATFELEEAARGRPIIVDAWYPAANPASESVHDHGTSRGRVACDSDLDPGPHPAIVLSHGAFGAARNYSWIAEYLARHGFIVLGVSHFGESWVYGFDRIDPASVTQPWHRPRDCSYVLDRLLEHPAFRGVIDPARIGALGHSTGGATAIELAGGVFDYAAMARYCASNVAHCDKGCEYARQGGAISAEESLPLSQLDSRIRAVVALDPALGPGHQPDSLAAIRIPVHVVGAVDNDFLPFKQHAARYASSIPGASLTRLDEGEGHFVFLDEGEADLLANGVPLYRDREGVDRAGVHARLATIISGFLVRHLMGGASEARVS